MAAPWTDERMLLALHLRDAEGMTAAEIGQRMGVSRGAVCGLFKRIADDLDRVPDRARAPKNRDGAMGAGWGLRLLRLNRIGRRR